MASTKLQYFKSESQSRADITIEMKAVSSEQIKNWTPEQKRKAREFFKEAERALQSFARAINKV